MGITLALIVVIAYALLGILSLAVFDLATKRISSKINQAASDTQSRLAATGNYVGGKMAFALFIGALWLFWPVVFIGALTDKKEGSDDAQKQA